MTAVNAADVRQARRSAVTFATLHHVPVESIASFPIPGIGPYGPAFAFMFAVASPDAQARDYALYEPEFAVAVDAASLEPAAYQRWRPAATQAEPPLIWRLPEPARSLPSGSLDALQLELLDLTAELAPLAWKAGAPPKRAGLAIQRYDELFRFLVPLELLPYYERLDSRFLSWLEVAVQRFGRLEGAMPTPAAHGGPPRLNLDPWD